MKNLIFFCFIFSGSILFANQNGLEIIDVRTEIADNEPTLSERWQSALGSFQFEILPGRKLTQINIQVIEEIEKVRHKTDVKYFMYDERIRVKVLPQSDIDAGKANLELRVQVDNFNNQ